ncbi:sensor histidine kinase [Dyadobacter crusticola]|uniref:sensor histidine kinase n=1 Tax=Dyadobacter crusticola TaxID=292407 RepID=UPI0004E25BAE|nr:GAF domain-containing sensor histidine kinase [Dyadobacter crusticola]
MKSLDKNFLDDLARIEQIPIIPKMLEVICNSTGMGFAAVARVTDEKWLACSVRDEIEFGLKPGEELPLKTTICNEIRERHELVVIDDVDKDATYCNHHTPQMYGFKSYISVPIYLKNGQFFGTLCAIDPKPAVLSGVKTVGMFEMFADLIAFHLQNVEAVEKSRQAVSDLNHQLADSININHQFHFISNHNLQEPLRKMRVFTGMLIEATEKNDTSKLRIYAEKVDSCAQQFSSIVTELSEFADLYNETNFEAVDLNDVVSEVTELLAPKLEAAEASVRVEALPTIYANRFQMAQLFSNLITNSMQFAKNDTAHLIEIFTKTPQENSAAIRMGKSKEMIELRIQDNGAGFSETHLERIFDIFSKFPGYKGGQTEGNSLAYCRKIVSNHGGRITAQSVEGKGTIFVVTLPLKRRPAVSY